MDTILEAQNLTKWYGKTQALANVSFSLPAGKIVGLLGPNGSGKTTLIKLIAGLLTPSSGTITIDNQSIGPETKAIVSYLPDRIYFDQNQTIEQLMLLYKDFYADFDEKKAALILQDLRIDPKKKISNLSKGTKEKVQLALVMSRQAKLYLLDEPIAGVDPAARDYILNTIISNYDPEATVLVSTHLIADVERVLDEFIFLYNGRVIRSGNAEDVREETGKSLDELFREVFRCLPNC